MRKSFLSLLTGGLLLAMASVSFSSYAADVHDNDYVTIGVPDLQQATAFFRNILDCEPVNPVAGNESPKSTRAGHATRDVLPASRLMLCDLGTVVELFDDHGMHSPAQHAMQQITAVSRSRSLPTMWRMPTAGCDTRASR